MTYTGVPDPALLIGTEVTTGPENSNMAVVTFVQGGDLAVLEMEL